MKTILFLWQLLSEKMMVNRLVVNINVKVNYEKTLARQRFIHFKRQTLERMFLLVVIYIVSLSSYSQNKYVNDIAYPSKTYLMNGVDNEIYIQPFLRRWRPYDDFVRFSGTVRYVQRLEKKVVINTANTGDTIRVDLINGDEFDVKKTVQSVVCSGEPKVGTKPVYAQFLGDSQTHGIFFKYAMLESGFVPNIHLVGTIAIKDHPGQFHEGRGGWSLFKYFKDEPTDPYFYNPFWQPQGKYRYWGNTHFWKNCILVEKDSSIKDFDHTYYCSGYDITSYGDDGRRLNPKENDVMWDSNLKKYIVWNKNRWKEFDSKELHWQFDYRKYLEMNHLKAPEFLVVLLGLNDFMRGEIHANFTHWNELVNTVLKSYKQCVPNGKLLLCTPCSSCGTLNNAAGDFMVRHNAVMWEVRKNVIDSFDNHEADGIYVVDASATIDNENGYNKGSDGIQTGNPHPYPNYPKMGIPIAACIQYYRAK